MPSRANTIKSTAKRLEVCERTVKGLIATGELESIKIGRCRRVTDDQIGRYLKRLEELSAS